MISMQLYQDVDRQLAFRPQQKYTKSLKLLSLVKGKSDDALI